jgi:hypothetical protein
MTRGQRQYWRIAPMTKKRQELEKSAVIDGLIVDDTLDQQVSEAGTIHRLNQHFQRSPGWRQHRRQGR